jgi:RIO-like serine/threonine protein kinase
MRITDFTDINETDKQFFIAWNQAMYAAKRGSEFLSDEDIRALLQSFARTAKKKNFKRISILIHSWTLFSVGRISAEDVTTFLNAFDTAEA